MSIVEMSKLRLVGISYEKEKVLNVLHRTGVVELKRTEEIENTQTFSNLEEIEQANAKLEKLNRAINIITDTLNKNKKTDLYEKDTVGIKDWFDCSYDEFIIASGNEFDVFYVIDKIFDYTNRISNFSNEKVKLTNLKKQLESYLPLTEKFSHFKSTKDTSVFLGRISQKGLDSFNEYFSDNDLVCVNNLSNVNDDNIISIICYNDFVAEVSIKLNELSFEKCPFNFDMTAQEAYANTEKDITILDEKLIDVEKKICRRASNLRNMKIYADYLNFQIEKMRASEEFRNTQTAFVLEGYLPTENAKEVEELLTTKFKAILVETSVIPRDEFAPTLTKNNKVFKSAEFITNMYSAPRYGEIDPNPSVFIFFMLFLGYIMADIGYGVLMLLAGVVGSIIIKRETGFKKILRIVGWGGVFTIIWGLVFASCFGFTLFKPLMPPTMVGDKVNKDNTMITLLFSLGLGIIHIAYGYIMKGLNCLKRSGKLSMRIIDSIFDGFLWVPFFVGLLMFGAKFLFDFFKLPTISFMSAISKPGLYMLLGSFALIALGSIKNGKGISKAVKPFGVAYGLINLLSDILSYARLFGLMLSGVVFSIKFDSMGVSMMTGGAGYVLGPLIIIIGHTFNLFMGILGAYIHDCRLQYIEYFSKFYDGEGELFKPFASQYNYINLTK